MNKFLLFIPVIVFFSACNALRPENVPLKLDGPEWKLTAINHKVVSPVGRAYLVFDGEDLEVKGKAFCNSISADYEDWLCFLRRRFFLRFYFYLVCSSFCDYLASNEPYSMMQSLRSLQMQSQVYF